MTRYTALLRSVNLGPTRRLKMDELRACAQSVVAADVASIVQTGNLIFESTASPEELESRLEAAIEATFTLKTLVFVRSAAHMAALVAHNPFPQQAIDDPAHLVAMTMRKPVSEAALDAVRAANTGPEQLVARGTDLYVSYPVDIGHSKLNGLLTEKRLGSLGTARNWNTVLKVAAALAN